MVLAAMLTRHPGELRADFRQYYGADLDRLRADEGELRAADLAVQLPAGSRTLRALRPELAWDDRDWLLWSIEFSLRVLRWQPTKDGRANRNKPRPLPTPGDRARVAGRIEATDLRYIADQLGIDLETEGLYG